MMSQMCWRAFWQIVFSWAFLALNSRSRYISAPDHLLSRSSISLYHAISRSGHNEIVSAS